MQNFDTLHSLRDICALTILFNVRDEFHASLGVIGNSDQALTISIHHEHADGSLSSHDLAGNDTLIALSVSDAESLCITARRDGGIVGSAILEVCLALTDVLPKLLIPRLCSNIIVDQCCADAIMNELDAMELAEVAR